MKTKNKKQPKEEKPVQPAEKSAEEKAKEYAAKRTELVTKLVAAVDKVSKLRQELMFAENELLYLAGHDAPLTAMVSMMWSWNHPDGSQIRVWDRVEEKDPGSGT